MGIFSRFSRKAAVKCLSVSRGGLVGLFDGVIDGANIVDNLSGRAYVNQHLPSMFTVHDTIKKGKYALHLVDEDKGSTVSLVASSPDSYATLTDSSMVYRMTDISIIRAMWNLRPSMWQLVLFAFMGFLFGFVVCVMVVR